MCACASVCVCVCVCVCVPFCLCVSMCVYLTASILSLSPSQTPVICLAAKYKGESYYLGVDEESELTCSPKKHFHRKTYCKFEVRVLRERRCVCVCVCVFVCICVCVSKRVKIVGTNRRGRDGA